MKSNKFVISILTLSISLNASAFSWSIGGTTIVKGDDPQVIKDLGEGAKKLGKEVGNGVRDTIGAVGNATGLTDIIDSNTETLAVVGRIYACQATLCLSEVLRKKQIDDAKAEADRELKKAKQKYLADYESGDKEKRRELALTALEAAGHKVKVLEEEVNLLQLRSDVVKTFNTALEAEKAFRKKLAEKNITNRPIAHREMEKSLKTYSANRSGGYQFAMMRVNDDLTIISQQTKRSSSALMAEFLRLADSQLLELISADISIEIVEITSTQVKLNTELTEAHLEYSNLKTAYDSGNY